MFTGLLSMNRQCARCGLVYEREPGYFLGSIYINYGLTAMSSTVAFLILRFGMDVSRELVIGGLLFFCIVFAVLFFRFGL